MIERIAKAREHCRSHKVAYDIGAHVGTYAGEISKFFDLVLAFEPVSKNYRNLTDNLSESSNIVPYNCGVSNRCGDVFFDISGKSISCHIAEAGEICKVIALDVGTWPAPCFMKIDVEGHELEVLRGAENLIRKNRPVMMIEEKFDDRFSASNLLVQWGYRQIWRKKHDRLFTWN